MQRLSRPIEPKQGRQISGLPALPFAVAPAFQGPSRAAQGCLAIPVRRPVLDLALSVRAGRPLFCSSKSSSATPRVRPRKEHFRAPKGVKIPRNCACFPLSWGRGPGRGRAFPPIPFWSRRRKPLLPDSSTSSPRRRQIRSRDSTAFGAPTTTSAMKFAICNEIFQGWKIEDAFACAAKVGYDAVEIAPFTIANFVTDISASERQKIRDLAARAGLAISGIHWVLAQTEGLHLTHPDAAVRVKTSKYLCDLVDFCGDLGGRIIVFGSPKQRNILDGVTPKAAWDWATAAFGEPAKQAENRDITICFEPLSAAETNFINTATEAIQFTQQFNSPHFKILLDVKAMCAEPKPIPQIIRDSWPHFRSEEHTSE